jgi:hypothetical protein
LAPKSARIRANRIVTDKGSQGFSSRECLNSKRLKKEIRTAWWLASTSFQRKASRGSRGLTAGFISIRDRAIESEEQSRPTIFFCLTRAWDHGSEVGFIKKLEDSFQRLAELILEGRVTSFDREQTHIISSFYVLWMARAEIRYQPEQDRKLPGILHGRRYSKDDEEQLEKAGLVFFRGSAMPGRILNGVRVQMQVMRYLRQVNPTACWGIIRAFSGEFLAPDWPVHAFIPISPVLALANHTTNKTLNREAVGMVNDALKSSSRWYCFARDFAACPSSSA